MKDLNLDETSQGMKAMTTGDRLVAFKQTYAALTYLALIEALIARIDALPAALRGRPLADLLFDSDVTRDNWLRALWYYCQMVKFCPTTTEAMRQAAHSLTERFGISLSDTRDTYAENQAKAEQHEKWITVEGPILAQISTPDQRTLAAWMEDFIQSGKVFGVMLGERGDTIAEADRSAAMTLRGEALGLLTELRTVLRREINARPELPANLDIPIEHHADILWLANWGFFLPPFMEISDTAMCKMPYDVEIIGIMSHYHKLGTKFTVDAWTPTGTTPIYEDDDSAHPKFQEYLPPISLAKGDGIQWTCTWNNTKPKPVGPGKNSTDEICITFALGYPKNTLSFDPIQCNITN
ncbi:MAG: hypothetical protein HUU55_21180 [Myxococcales bacterium]|nr:hypothetical protein [Myxococcales bacterium]